MTGIVRRVELARSPISQGTLQGIAEDAVRDQIGPGTEWGYEAAIITFRDSNYEDAGLGVYVADEHARDVINQRARERGMEIALYDGPVSPGGGVHVASMSRGSASSAASASASSAASASSSATASASSSALAN